jgi:hypothetical protein
MRTQDTPNSRTSASATTSALASLERRHGEHQRSRLRLSRIILGPTIETGFVRGAVSNQLVGAKQAIARPRAWLLSFRGARAPASRPDSGHGEAIKNAWPVSSIPAAISYRRDLAETIGAVTWASSARLRPRREVRPGATVRIVARPATGSVLCHRVVERRLNMSHASTHVFSPARAAASPPHRDFSPSAAQPQRANCRHHRNMAQTPRRRISLGSLERPP